MLPGSSKLVIVQLRLNCKFFSYATSANNQSYKKINTWQKIINLKVSIVTFIIFNPCVPSSVLDIQQMTNTGR